MKNVESCTIKRGRILLSKDNLIVAHAFNFPCEFLKQIQFPCRPSRLDGRSSLYCKFVSLHKSFHYANILSLGFFYHSTQTDSLLLSHFVAAEHFIRVRCLRAHFVCTQTANCLHSAVTHNSQFQSQTVETWHSTNNTFAKVVFNSYDHLHDSHSLSLCVFASWNTIS